MNLPRAEPLMVDSATVMDVLISPSITETTSVTTPSDLKTVYSSISNPMTMSVKNHGKSEEVQEIHYVVIIARQLAAHTCWLASFPGRLVPGNEARVLTYCHHPQC